MFTGTITGVGRIVAAHDLDCSSIYGTRLTIEGHSKQLDVSLGARSAACWAHNLTPSGQISFNRSGKAEQKTATPLLKDPA
jgi:hypothetical protein